MAQDNIILINKEIQPALFNTTNTTRVNFSNYKGIYEILRTKKTKETQKLKIYDITYHPHSPHHTIIPINDHINRIGDNPFIGQQKFFNIDFINVEKIYIKNLKGVITTSYGNRYQQYKKTTNYSSTHIANIVVLAQIQSYKVQGYLVNQP